MIVMVTQKSRGYVFGEGVRANHSMPIKPEEAEEAVKVLLERRGK